MSEHETTTCPSCGESSRDDEWCEHCGARLDLEDAAEWLSKDDEAGLLTPGEDPLRVVVESAIDTFATRRVSYARVKAGPEALVGSRILLEETEGGTDLLGEVPDELEDLFRAPMAVGKHGPHVLQAYRDTGAVTVEDLVDITGLNLSYQQVKECFLAILDAVESAHRERHLILAIAPWTVRLENAKVPETEKPTRYRDGDETLESRRPDPSVLEAATDAAEAEIEAERSDPKQVEEKRADETEIEHTLDLPVEDVSGLSGRTLPSHRIPDLEFDDGEGNIFGGPGDDALHDDDERSERSAADDSIDDGWSEFEEADSEGMSETGVLSPSAIMASDEPEISAFFEGLEELFPFDEDPYEVPVIMGFSPPELLGRVRADLGPHCDIFALGMLLYYMLAGRVPPASVYTRYTPALPARNFRPGFPPGFQSVIGRATRPSPADRFASVQAMRDAFTSACALMERRARDAGSKKSPRAIIAVDTHVGIAKGRRNPVNQDSVFGRITDDGKFSLMVVADGVSTASYGSGDLASHHLTDTAAEVWDDVLPKYLLDERIDEVEIISSILVEANKRIVKHVNEHCLPFEGNPHEVMGTTALIGIIREGVMTLAALGDSRVYVQTTSGLEQVTADHNLWTLSILDGISADAALSMPHGDALARCLGTFVIEDKRLTAVPPDADYFRFALTRGDTVLMTTDGLIDFAGANPFASEENVLAVMLAEPDPALACLELILLANRGGGGDNIGVGIAHFV